MMYSRCDETFISNLRRVSRVVSIVRCTMAAVEFIRFFRKDFSRNNMPLIASQWKIPFEQTNDCSRWVFTLMSPGGEWMSKRSVDFVCKCDKQETNDWQVNWLHKSIDSSWLTCSWLNIFIRVSRWTNEKQWTWITLSFIVCCIAKRTSWECGAWD